MEVEVLLYIGVVILAGYVFTTSKKTRNKYLDWLFGLALVALGIFALLSSSSVVSTKAGPAMGWIFIGAGATWLYFYGYLSLPPKKTSSEDTGKE